MVTVSAPGKIHLMGEHAVVYGHPAFLAAINKRTSVTVAPYKNGIHIVSNDSAECVQKIATLVVKHLRLSGDPDVTISVTSDIPVGYHLGSSAAVAVATVGALLFFLKKVWNPTLINQLAYEAEKLHHGNPSGGDNTTSTFGGFLWFRKELTFLNSIWQLPKLTKSKLTNFFLINTGKPEETTCEMVTSVGVRVKTNPFLMEQIFSANEVQTKRVAEALKNGDQQMLTDAIRNGERTLEEMGVVSARVTPFIRKIEEAEGAAKILGGGGCKNGVGFLLCFHPDRNNIQKICDEEHYSIEEIRLGEEGVRLDEK
jgi:mevalonate kinase